MEVKKESIITDLSNVSDHEIKRPDSLKNIILRHANSDNETVGGREDVFVCDSGDQRSDGMTPHSRQEPCLLSPLFSPDLRPPGRRPPR